MHTPVLAEHGHRLLGALLGLWAIGLVVWTFVAEQRRRVRMLAVGILGLVVLQGILGGLRVIWVSLDLAVVHALGAQLFFASIMVAAVVTSASWMNAPEPANATPALKRLSVATAAALFVQIVLGALLRHPGAGVHLGFTLTHVTGSIVVLVLILMLSSGLRRQGLLSRWAWSLTGGVALQMMLGVMALMVLLYENSVGAISLGQVVLNSAHLVVGTLLLGLTVGITLQLLRPPC